MKPTKKDIQALAVPKVIARYAVEIDQQLYLESVILAAGFDISLTDKPLEWEAAIDWLEGAMA